MLKVLSIFLLLFLTACSKKNWEEIPLEEAVIVEKEEQELEEKIYVYVCGAVMYPGVYELEAGSRIVAAIEAAGGFSEDAAEETINLAEHISDGMQIIVQTREQADALQYVKEMQKSGRINLNIL